MREDAKNELWMPMRIGNIQGWFSDMRIERSSVPEWLHFWELADEDSNGDPCWYKRNIIGNFFGTFVTTGILPVNDEEWEAGDIREREWEIDWGKAITFDAMINKETEKAEKL